LFVAVVLLLAVGEACSDSAVQVDFSRPEATAGAQVLAGSQRDTLRIAVAPVLSARPTSALYEQLAAYLSGKLGRPVELVQGKTYSEINDMLKSGDVTVALVCTNPYLQGKDDFGMELIAAPEVDGELVYYSLLIVNKSNRAASLKDLRGATFAFSDPLSNSGRLAPTYQLAKLGSNPDSYFSQTIFTYSHDSSIRAVADGVVAAAAVDSLVFNYLSEVDPALTGKVSVIERWGPFGINPVVVNPHLDAETKAELRRVFLGMNDDPAGESLLSVLGVDRFMVPDDSLYDSVREMRTFLRERGLSP
jgi:phosphonate transport system substrate-binding protein